MRALGFRVVRNDDRLALAEAASRHTLRQDASALQGLVAQGAQVLACGSKDMAAGVRAVLETLLAQRGGSVDELRLQGRYREDVY